MKPHSRSVRLCVIGFMLSAVAAGSSGQVKTVKKNSAIPPSHWGGEHAAMEVTADGAQLEFDCAHGQITGPVRLNRNGNFDVAGTFSPEHGGPVLRDEESSTPPARLTGQVKGDTLVLKVIPAGAKEPSGTFTLVKGAEPRLMKCR